MSLSDHPVLQKWMTLLERLHCVYKPAVSDNNVIFLTMLTQNCVYYNGTVGISGPFHLWMAQ